MINFNEIKYERPNFDEIKAQIESLTQALSKENNYASYLEICKKIIALENHLEEMYDYADIKNMRNLNDEFFNDEIAYWNRFKTQYDLLFIPFYKLIITSPFKKQLLKVMPKTFFTLIEYQLKITSDDIILLQQKENELKTQYRTLYKETIFFDGEERSLGYITGQFSNKNRNIRKKAHDTLNDYFYARQKEFDEILYELICVRNEIARILGFNNYVEYSLYKLKRLGYDYGDINKFRENIIKYIIPLCKKITLWQKSELGLEKIKYYDQIYFKEMPNIKFSREELLDNLAKSFQKLDDDLYRLFIDMLSNGYIDLTQRKDKVNFSITNYLTESKVPVVTGNYKNTYMDVKTTTHEIGHSYQKYNASIKDKDYIVSSLLKYPTMEIAEMFSYSMELLMLPHVDNIFIDEDYPKYCLLVIINLINNLPYICLVDEFQENIYQKTDLTISDIRKTWLKLVKKYHLESQNMGHINLDTGGYFYRQSHIFLDPFYYIDYGLSYFGAFAIWCNCENDLNNFREIASSASYYTFKELIEKFHMPNPFDEAEVKKISLKLEEELIKRLK